MGIAQPFSYSCLSFPFYGLPMYGSAYQRRPKCRENAQCQALLHEQEPSVRLVFSSPILVQCVVPNLDILTL